MNQCNIFPKKYLLVWRDQNQQRQMFISEILHKKIQKLLVDNPEAIISIKETINE